MKELSSFLGKAITVDKKSIALLGNNYIKVKREIFYLLEKIFVCRKTFRNQPVLDSDCNLKSWHKLDTKYI